MFAQQANVETFPLRSILNIFPIPHASMQESISEPVDILIVEDNPCDIELTLRALREKKLSYSVEVVRDGTEALNYLLRTGPHANRHLKSPRLVLLDLKMPKMNGIEVLRHIKANSHTQMIPVVILSSSDSQRDILDSYRYGANSFLVKSVDFERFATSLEKTIIYWMELNQVPEQELWLSPSGS